MKQSGNQERWPLDPMALIPLSFCSPLWNQTPKAGILKKNLGMPLRIQDLPES